jgi:hypothetical protein
MSNPPPPYEEATKGTQLVPSPSDRDGPPTYDQLFGISNLRDAKRESDNHATFAFKFFEVICGTVACAICMLILAALPVSMIVIGSVYVHDCEDRKTIPIWLIVFGCVSLVQTVIDLFKRVFKKKREDEEEGPNRDRYANRSGNCLESFLSFFLFVWIIIGSAWVFGYYTTFKDCRNLPNEPCCHPVPYLFSFVTLIVIYSVSLLICCCCCFVFCLTALIGGATD